MIHKDVFLQLDMDTYKGKDEANAFYLWYAYYVVLSVRQ